MSSRRKSSTKPEGLSQLNLNAAGIDVGATSHYVAVPADRAEQPVREFEAFTADLYRLADWLTECGVETVVMESTGVYWIPLFGVLEERGFQVMLVDPRRIKNVPGRKTDVLDCQWLQQLHTYGLLSGAFRPDGDIRRLRSYLRQRVMLVQYASHHIQHMQKALTQMNVKLHHVISNITGKTGTEIMEAIVGGQRDPRQLAQLRDPRIKADEATIAKSLQGHWREEHIFELTQALELYRFYQDKIAECDREIEAQLERFEDHSNGDPPAAKSGRRRSKGNAPRFDVWTHLYRMTGVDLTQIDGVDAYTALKVVSEIGTDMTKWPSVKHFASWLGLSPNNRITGGKVISSKTKPSANRAAAALRLAANALHRSDSALGRLPAPEESPPGSAQGHYRHGTQAGQAHLHHAALWPGVRGCWCGTLRETVSAAGVARRQASGGPTGLPTGTNVRRRGPHHVRTSRRANRRVTTLVSGEVAQTVESRSMVMGASRGPGPVDRAWASSSRLIRSSWRTWPHRKLRRNVPRVDGALTTQPMVPAVPPVRNTSASSMQSPPASADATSVITLSPMLARPGARPRSRCRSTSSGRPRCRPSVAGRISPALATRRWSSKAIWMRSGWSSASIFWVLLAWGRFPVSKAIIPDGQEHFLTPSAHRDTHLFGGLGLRKHQTMA